MSEVQRFMATQRLEPDGETFKPMHCESVPAIHYDALAAELAEAKASIASCAHEAVTCSESVMLKRIRALEAALREGLGVFRAMESPDGVPGERTQAWRRQAHGLLHPNDRPTAESKCPDCGVYYVKGARHFSECPSQPGRLVK